jgi:hypothetical protein
MQTLAMISLNWQRRLAAATTEAQVVVIAHEFVATLSAVDIERLPHVCRPGRIIDGRDIIAYAAALVHHHCDDDSATQRLVYQLTEFFSSAALRVSAIGAIRVPAAR